MHAIQMELEAQCCKRRKNPLQVTSEPPLNILSFPLQDYPGVYSLNEWEFISLNTMKDCLPKSIVFWNSIKSPVDVMSRLISHAKVRNSNASILFVWQRMILISLVFAYRMYQVLSLSGRI